MRIRDVATGEVLSMCRTFGSGDSDCAFDPSKLREVAGRIRSACESSADLVFVSRFGKEEARGGGFRGELLNAASEGCTVLTALRRGNVDNWLCMNGGVGTLLDSRLWVLHAWWDDLRRAMCVE
jgi:hypothetical protein